MHICPQLISFSFHWVVTFSQSQFRFLSFGGGNTECSDNWSPWGSFRASTKPHDPPSPVYAKLNSMCHMHTHKTLLQQCSTRSNNAWFLEKYYKYAGERERQWTVNTEQRVGVGGCGWMWVWVDGGGGSHHPSFCDLHTCHWSLTAAESVLLCSLIVWLQSFCSYHLFNALDVHCWIKLIFSRE